MTTTASNFHWKCKHTWKQSAHNTKWCLIGCAIGDLGTIYFFQMTGIPWSTLAIMSLAIINGLLTSIALETFILMRQQLNFQQALKTALGMSFISMISMEAAMNITDVVLTGGSHADLVGSSYHAFCGIYYSLALQLLALEEI